MVSLLNKSFWLTCHKPACHTTEYILALDRCSWTTRGVWGPSSKEKCVMKFTNRLQETTKSRTWIQSLLIDYKSQT